MKYVLKGFWHKKTPWIVTSVLSCIGLILSYYFFPRVFPILSLNIEINRHQALSKARTFTKKYNLGPNDYLEAALFVTDTEAKNFIELEGGGKQALITILEEQDYIPYSWDVRHFNDGQIEEAKIQFRPNGSFYGFTQTCAETTPGPALTKEEAKKIAEKSAQAIDTIDFSTYVLAEHTQERQTNGRIDHTFCYETINKKIGGAPYTLHLKISGDTLTVLERNLKIPETFKRRYKEMRSFNTSLYYVASFLASVLYLIGGGILGIFYLLRRTYIEWKMALVWALIISIGEIANNINEIPLIWYHYDTALSLSSFWIQLLLHILFSFFLYFGQLFVILTAAEGLTRLAFPSHLQLWKLWNSSVAATWQVLGRTVGAYLLLGWDFFFCIAFYFMALQWLGWWSPTEALTNPNIFSMYLPWFSSLITSLRAGFMEECWFRAIPLSCAALFGKRFGNQRLWIGIMMIFQACVFGAAHANYPAQPFYARLIELIIPSLVFGTIYLYFGLLTSIVSHYLYDVIWFALPIFASTAKGIWFDKGMVLLGSGIPLIIVLYAIWKKNGIYTASDIYYNKAWTPPLNTNHPMEDTGTRTTYERLPKYTVPILLFSGFISIIVWGSITHSSLKNIHRLTIDYSGAYRVGEQFIKDNQLPKEEWSILTEAIDPLSEQKGTSSYRKNKKKDHKISIASAADQHRFVWQTIGNESYHTLIGNYLESPYWRIRLVKYTGDVSERAEEYTLYANAEKPFRVFHKRAEDARGTHMSELIARIKAGTVLSYTDKINEPIHEISALASKKPYRTDWSFVFKTSDADDLVEKRIKIDIANNQTDDHQHYIFVPQDWLREEQQRMLTISLIGMLCTFCLTLCKAFAAGQALLAWVDRRFNISIFLLTICILGIKTAIQVWNLFPSFIAHFETNQPYNNQLLHLILQILLQSTIRIMPIALIAGLVATYKYSAVKNITTFSQITAACSLGTIGAAVLSLGYYISPSLQPLLPDFADATARIPFVSVLLSTFTRYLTTIVLSVFLLHLLYTIRNRSYAMLLCCLVLVGIGFCSTGIEVPSSTTAWILQSIFLTITCILGYITFYQYDERSLIISIATFFSYHALGQALYNVYPGAFIGNLLSIFMIWILAFLVTQHMQTIATPSE
jgi:hypothetical protein